MRDAKKGQQLKRAKKPMTNAYCARLELPVPRVENVVTKTDAKLFHLMVVTLLERGEPLSLEAICERLRVAGVTTATGDMETSLLKSWHGSKPVFRDDRGYFALDVTARELKSIIFRLELRPSKRPLVNWQTAIEPVADDVPLTEAEVRAAFESASPDNLSNVRRIAAVLDIHGEPMSITDAEVCVAAWNSTPSRVNLSDIQRWPKSCVSVVEGDLLQIVLQSPHLFTMRRAVRKLAERRLRQATIDEQLRIRRQAYEACEAERRKHDRALAVNLRRSVLRVVPDRGAPAAAALLDIGQRVIRSFVGSELLELPEVLQDYDLIAALWTRETLYSLSIRDHDPWRLVDLKPPQKTRQLNRAGRKLTITPELLITGSTGISRPLGDPAKIAQYLAGDQETKLRRRLESDVKSLLAFYNYGLLHRRVRLRWGFLDEDLGVDWAQPGDPSLHGVLEERQASRQEAEIVYGSAPGWSDPWSRFVRVKILSFDFMSVRVESNERTWTIPRDEIQAIRVVA
jgi:hypothetical protein